MPAVLYPRVAVPARNEARRLAGLVRALDSQTWQRRSGCRLPVVIALNNCTDGSAQLLARLRSETSALDVEIVEAEFEPALAHVGSARRLAMEAACFGARADSRTVLLTTDADAVPHPDWVTANLAAIAAGADAIGGDLQTDLVEERALGRALARRADQRRQYLQLADRLASLIDPIPWDPSPRHYHHTGASLAIRADAYRCVGGFRPIRCREDLDLVARLGADGFRLRHSLEARVTVSARISGRASGGMADCIRGWLEEEAEGRVLMVEDPEKMIRRLEARNVIRRRGGSLQKVGRLIEASVPDVPDAPRTVEVHDAIAMLDRMLKEFEDRSDAA